MAAMKPLLPKPDFRGQFDGQVTTLDVKVAKVKDGKVVRFPWRTPTGETRWMVVKETQCQVQWAWDAVEGEWVTENVWKARRNAVEKGRVLASKHTDLHKRLAERQRRENARLKRERRKKKSGGGR